LTALCRPLTVSSYSINNLEAIQLIGKHIYLIIALSSGQVVLYRSMLPNIHISHDHRSYSHSIMYTKTAGSQGQEQTMDFEFLTQVMGHYQEAEPSIRQRVRVAPLQHDEFGHGAYPNEEIEDSMYGLKLQGNQTAQSIDLTGQFLIQCISQYGELHVFCLDLV